MQHNIELILYKAFADLKVEVARGYLGIIWWVVEPVLYMGAFYIIFGIALERGGPGFVPYLLTGLIVWKWFDSSIKKSAKSITQGKGLMLQVYLPKVFFASVSMVSNSVKFLVTLVLLLAFVILSGHEPGLAWFALPLVIFIQFALIAGGSYLLSSLIPMWPDLMLIVNNVMMLMFFLSGIFFDTSKLTGVIGDLINLNPMVHIITGYRDILLHNVFPDWQALGIVFLFSVVLVWLGLHLLKRYDQIYPRLL